jgi:putative transposase
VRFHFIAAEKANYPINLMCRCLSVSRSGYYAWSGRPRCARSQEDERLKVQIAASHAASKGRYGSPRILRDLHEAGAFVSRKRVARLMGDRRDRRATKAPLSGHDGL